MSNNGSYTVGFSGQCIEIGYNSPEARSLAEFLFCDLLTESAHPPRARYDILVVGNPSQISLWQGNKKLYFGESKYKPAYMLINEVIYHCIVDYSKGHAVHAGALSSHDQGILVPGKSGSGKSTFTAWLASKGLHYLSDELVFISENGNLHPFTRPLSLKNPDHSLLSTFIDLNVEQDKLINEPRGVMIPHRLIQPDFRPGTPPLSLILFTHFQPGAEIEITPLSSARSCFQLMECHVNTRNISGHGFNDLAELTRQTEAYQLTYGSFDGLFERLQPILSRLPH